MALLFTGNINQRRQQAIDAARQQAIQRSQIAAAANANENQGGGGGGAGAPMGLITAPIFPGARALYNRYLGPNSDSITTETGGGESAVTSQTPSSYQAAPTGGGLENAPAPEPAHTAPLPTPASQSSGIPSVESTGESNLPSTVDPDMFSESTSAVSDVAPLAAEEGAAEATPAATEGLAGMGAGQVASLAAPIVMSLLAYGRGSGRNDPVIRRNETLGAERLMEDLLKGKDVKMQDLYGDYGLPIRYAQGYNPATGWSDAEGVVPQASEFGSMYTPAELYQMMHERGSGMYQPNGTGNSGFTDQQIDDMLRSRGINIQQQLGLNVPNWANLKYKDWAPGVPNYIKLHPEMASYYQNIGG